MVILATLLTAFVQTAASANLDRVDELVQREMAARHIPGCVVAVVKDGKTLKESAYGKADVELNCPMGLGSVFEIGSVTKQMTATLVLMLAEQGKLRLDSPIKDLLPATPAKWKAIRLKHLLGHTSGLRNINDVEGFEVRAKLTRNKFVSLLAKQPLEFAPGAQYAYRNTGYALAGYVIEQACRKPYWAVLKERILDPLEMTSTQSRDLPKIIPGRAKGYEWENGRLVNRGTDLTDIFAAGAVASTVGDLLKWNAAVDSGRLLGEKSRRAMWTPGRLNDGKPTKYGLGWGIGVYRGERLISHGGSTAGFSASISKFVDRNVTVIVLTNLGKLNNATDLARAIAAEYIEFRN